MAGQAVAGPDCGVHALAATIADMARIVNAAARLHRQEK
jgi:hypothetical protein